MSTEDKNKTLADMSDEDGSDDTAKKTEKGVTATNSEEPPQSAASSDGATVETASKKRGRPYKQPKLDLTTIDHSAPRASKHRQTMKELVAEKNKVKKERQQAANKNPPRGPTTEKVGR